VLPWKKAWSLEDKASVNYEKVEAEIERETEEKHRSQMNTAKQTGTEVAEQIVEFLWKS